jgi:hypothetical protein
LIEVGVKEGGKEKSVASGKFFTFPSPFLESRYGRICKKKLI